MQVGSIGAMLTGARSWAILILLLLPGTAGHAQEVDCVVRRHVLLGDAEVGAQLVHLLRRNIAIAVVSPLHVQAYPPQRMRNSIRTGQTAEVILTEPAGTAYPATVTVVDQVFDAASGTFGVQLDLRNAEAAISGGQRCRVSFDSLAERAR